MQLVLAAFGRTGEGNAQRVSCLAEKITIVTKLAHVKLEQAPRRSHPLSRSAVVVLQQAAEPFPADDLSFKPANIPIRGNDLIAKPLVIALGVIVLYEVVERSAQHPSCESQHLGLSARVLVTDEPGAFL